MPPKAAAAAAEGASSGPVINGVTLGLTETKVVCAIIENLTTRIDADWQKVADSLGQKNAKSAREAWRVLRKKCNLNLDGFPDGNAAASAGGTSTPAASAKKAATVKAAGTQTGEGGTPVKRGRGRPLKNKPALLMTPGAGGDDSPGLSTPGTALGNMALGGDMTPETPSKVGSGVKRSAEEADPDAILFEDTPAKKKPAVRKRLTAEQRAAQKAAEVEAAKQAAEAAVTEESADATTVAGLEPASSPADMSVGEGDSLNINVALDRPISEAEQAIREILVADAAEAADLVGGIDPGEA